MRVSVKEDGGEGERNEGRVDDKKEQSTGLRND